MSLIFTFKEQIYVHIIYSVHDAIDESQGILYYTIFTVIGCLGTLEN